MESVRCAYLPPGDSTVAARHHPLGSTASRPYLIDSSVYMHIFGQRAQSVGGGVGLI